MDEIQTEHTSPAASTRLRFLDLPAALAPLVVDHGLPQVQVSEEMSVFCWASLPSREEGDGLILGRVEDEEMLDSCVSGIEALVRALSEDGLTPGAIMASCGSSELGGYYRIDLGWANTLAQAAGSHGWHFRRPSPSRSPTRSGRSSTGSRMNSRSAPTSNRRS